MVKEYSRKQQTNMARKDGLWRQLGGFKINEVERGQTIEDSKCQETCILYATKVCQKLLSKRVTAIERGNVMLKDQSKNGLEMGVDKYKNTYEDTCYVQVLLAKLRVRLF